MKTLSHILIAIALLTLVGSITPDDAMKPLLHHPKADVIAAWGPPDNVISDGAGGEAWTYFIHRQWTTPGHAETTVTGNANTFGNATTSFPGTDFQANTRVSGNATTTYTPPQTSTSTVRRTFFIDSSGVVYRYSWDGL